MSLPLRIEVSPGEVLDRIGILELKVSHAQPGPARRTVEAERDRLRAALAAAIPDLTDFTDVVGSVARLATVNGALWQVEDALRLHETEGAFGPDFIERARSVYRLNDERAALKRAIDVALGATLRDEKIYR